MRYLTLAEVLELHQRIISQAGGAPGLRDVGSLESALAQPRMTFEGQELYATLLEKASALAFSLVMNHPFLDGNKRVGHAALEIFLLLNGWETSASVDEQEQVMLDLAAGTMTRDQFTLWPHEHVIEVKH
jgi:death-on-curing protein